MAIPKPGRKVRGSSTGRPIMALLDLLGRRWSLRILWELRGDALSFRSLRAAAGGVSPTVLNARLVELRDAGFVASTAAGYRLTDSGRQLFDALAALYEFAEEWGKP